MMASRFETESRGTCVQWNNEEPAGEEGGTWAEALWRVRRPSAF